MNNGDIIAITGGIGSGKSIVSRILLTLGYKVYDCDSQAKRIMSQSQAIKSFLLSRISPLAVRADGTIDRSVVADVVFADPTTLDALNNCVHGEVAADFYEWSHSFAGVKFVETAILYQSGFDRLVNEVWEVTAPVETRIMRVMARNNCRRADVEKRIESQDSFCPERRHGRTFEIVNDGFTALLPQIESLITRR